MNFTNAVPFIALVCRQSRLSLTEFLKLTRICNLIMLQLALYVTGDCQLAGIELYDGEVWLNVELLRHRRIFLERRNCWLFAYKSLCSKGFSGFNSWQPKESRCKTGHGLFFAVNLRLDFCETGRLFLPQTKPDHEP